MNPSPQKVLALAFLSVLVVTAAVFGQKAGKDNLGKEFFVAFAANQGANPDFAKNDTNLFALYLTGPVAASGYVEVPALNFRQNFTTTPGQITTVSLPDGDDFGGPTVEIRTSESVIAGMGVHVVADTEIAVYGMSHKRFSSDAFMAMPLDVLGTEYRAISYPTSSIFSGDTPGEFWIVAIADSTNVTITPAASTAQGKPAGSRFSILMNRGDVYLVMGDANRQTNDLTGSLIESELPIAVFSGHERTEIPQGARNRNPEDPSEFLYSSRDHLVEQLPPVSAWGDSALVIPFATSDNPDLVRIISAEDNNTITINGTFSTTLNAGKFYEIKSLSGPTAISATNPIMVGQYMHTSEFGLGPNSNEPDPINPAYGDPALALVYPVEQFATSYTFISVVNPAAFAGNFVNVVVEQSGAAGITLDGVPIAGSQFKTIPGSTFVYAQIPLQQGTHNISGPKPFGITVYAMGGVDSYAYTGGTLLKTITPFKTVDLVIDFGDRVLNQDFSGSWDTTVYLQNISSDPLTIFGFLRRSGDVDKFWVVDSAVRVMQPGERGSMTIRFEPLLPDRRMHTVIQAKTEHLRAYVVDVYGRGVIGRPGSYAQPTSSLPIDTIDFGVIGENSPPHDTLAYIVNKGSADVTIDSIRLWGPDANDFRYFGATINTVPAPLPFVVPKTSLAAAELSLQFRPSLPRAGRLAYLDYSAPTGQTRRIVLIARVDTIELATVSPAVFDSILICESDDGVITIFNPNTFTIRLEGLTITGPNASDFSLLTNLPLDIGSEKSVNVNVRFAPNSPGPKTATVTASFDIPVGAKRVFQIQAVGKQLNAAFRSPQGIGILGNDEILFPIYAITELSRYQCSSYILDLNYDPTYITDIEPVLDNTLMPYSWSTVEGDNPGARRYTVNTSDGSYLSGGPNDTVPLIYIKFKAQLGGADLLKIYAPIDIHYKISFVGSPLPTHCIASDPEPGRIIIDSACAIVHVVKQAGIPNEMFIDYPSPNPVAGGTVSLYLYLPQDSPVRLEVFNMLGVKVTTILQEPKEAGRYKVLYDPSHLAAGEYFVRFEAAGKVRTRRLGIVR